MTYSTVGVILFNAVTSCVALLVHSEVDPFGDRDYVHSCKQPRRPYHPFSSKLLDDITPFSGPPRILWQTEKQYEKDLPEVVTSIRRKWSALNNGIEMKYMGDEEALAFVEANFDKSVLDAFKGFPLGVMRADFWRYLVVYTYGGMYADVDVEPNVSISEWFRDEKNWQRCSMVVGQENAVHLSQWTFAATPKHPALKEVIDLIVARYQEGIKLDYQHFVHYHTGPGVFTNGIHKYASRTSTSCESMPACPGIMPGHAWMTTGTRMCFLSEGSFSQVVHNRFGSRDANFTKEFGSWTKERDDLVDSNKRQSHPRNVPCRCAHG
jgi:hypothetical protein